jgi:hypothetical protein
MEIGTKTVQNCISEELSVLVAEMTPNQIRLIVAAQDYPTLKEAAEAIGVAPRTVYNWPEEVKRAIELFAQDSVSGALAIRRRYLSKAMAVKVTGLDSDDEGVRQRASTEIIEWELGKATQKQELTGRDGAPLKTYVTISPDDWDARGGE